MNACIFLLLVASVCSALPTKPDASKIGPRHLELVYAQPMPQSAGESMIPAETFWGGYYGNGGRGGWRSDNLSPYGAVYVSGDGLYGSGLGWKDNNAGRVEYSGWRGDTGGTYGAPSTWNGAGPGWRN